ncbi:MAG: hypothetical protein H6706_09750 [Myxococcales bacterium]|nr:hypothetical protein [Myxococcales bacterium]
MSSHTDAFQDALQKRRRLGVLVAIGIVLAAGGGVLAVMFWPPPAAPAGAQVALSTVEGEGFSLGCPEGWRSHGGKLITCNASDEPTAMCIVVAEPLGSAMSPEDYWKQAQRFSRMMMGGAAHERDVRNYSVGDLRVRRIITDDDGISEPTHHLYYIYVPEKTAFVVTCSSPSRRFDALLPTFETVAQSFRLK